MRTIKVICLFIFCLGFLFVLGLSTTETEAAPCLAKGKSCILNAPANDRLCCPGMVCGWGDVCQPGCRINGTFHPSGATNPENPCQSCQPTGSTTSWSNVRAGTTCGSSSSSACDLADKCDGAGRCAPNNKPNGTTCNDGNACTQTDRCQSGSCVGTPKVCAASDSCHDAGTCNPGTGVCSNPPKPNGAACSDGNGCTQTDTCQSGSCVGSNPRVCTASDSCHDAGTCNPGTGVCSNPPKPNGAACSDGTACTQTDSCQSGSCVGSNPVVCTPSDQCHEPATCDPATGACSNRAKPDGSACNDGTACTQTDTCQGGTCIGTNPVTCAPPEPCFLDGTCDPGTGRCSYPPAPDQFPCEDGDFCTLTGTCESGTCVGSNPVVCTASDSCHEAGTCDPTTGACSNPQKPDGEPCENGLSCVGTCQAGVCTRESGPSAITVEPGSSPAGGYLPLSGFGIPPIGGMGDDTLINFNVPPFLYAGDTYTSLAVTSNGYVVVGGGADPQDNSFINHNLPDPLRPNNVLAPFWTDLNPAVGGGVRIATLTDTVDTWIVVDWENVPEFGSTTTVSTQIWIGISVDTNPGEDISYAYGPIQGNGAFGGLTVGAEDACGTVGSTYYFNGAGTLPSNGTQLRVTTFP